MSTAVSHAFHRALAALAAFVEGFVGLGSRGLSPSGDRRERCAHSMREALEQRASTRRSCC